MANLNDLKTSSEDPENPLIDIDFWIHVDKKSMRSGFLPKEPISGETVILLLSLGIRGICCLLAEKMDMDLEEVHSGLMQGLQSAFSDQTDEMLNDTESKARDDHDEDYGGLGDNIDFN